MRGWWAIPAALSIACASTSDPAFDPSGGWVLDVDRARLEIEGGATILDVRTDAQYRAGHLVGAVRADWQEFSEPNEPNKGLLLGNDNVLGYLLRRKGVFAERAVVVVGDPIEGWGEDGRVVWMLRTLGHHRAGFVDGGHAALVKAGLPVTEETPAVKEGDFVVRRTDRWLVDRTSLEALVKEPGNVLFVDNREPREYAGETPYGESRGGHLPGAINLHYRELLGTDGRLLSRATMSARLADKGITPARPLVAYCTGGVRSGWFVAVLTELGFEGVRNYAGSMWEWSAADDLPLDE